MVGAILESNDGADEIIFDGTVDGDEDGLIDGIDDGTLLGFAPTDDIIVGILDVDGILNGVVHGLS